MPTPNQVVQFKAGLQTAFDGIDQKDLNTIYFVTDTQRLFVGETEYTRPIQHGAELPSGYAPNNSLFVKETGSARELHYSKDGTSWDMIAQLPATITGGVFGDNTETTLGFSGTFSIPKVTVDDRGNVTAIEDVTMTLPAAPADAEVQVTTSGSGNVVTNVAKTPETTTGITVTLGTVPTTEDLEDYAALAGANFTGPVTVQAPTSEMNPATKQYVDNLLSANDAMVFKGTVGGAESGATVTDFSSLADYQVGWTYRVIEAGTYAGASCEVGDLLIAVADYSESFKDADWTVAQTNIDGAVTAAANLTNGAIVTGNGAHGVQSLANGTEGQILKIVSGTPTWSEETENTDTTYTFTNGSEGSFQVQASDGEPQTVTIGKPATAGTADKVANKLTINGTEYDGSAAQSVTIPTEYDLDDLTDVEVTTPAANQAIIYDGTSWKNRALTKADVGLGNVDNTADASKNVASAGKLTTPVTIGLSGAATGTATSFDGSQNITIPVTALNAANLSGAIPEGVTAVTADTGDSSTAIATTEFVTTAVEAAATENALKWGAF